jgi:RND family efflux transporter MFP subunit
MRHARKIAFSAIAVALAAAVGSIEMVSFGSQRAAAEDPRRQPQLVELIYARPAQASQRSFTGLVSARVQSNLGFRVSGKIVQRFVDAGEVVRAGQPLMRIDPTDIQLGLTAKENAVAAAKATAVQAAADEERYRKLVEDGWSTRQRYEQAKAVFDSANAQLAAAEAQAEVARNETGYSLLAADADGTVVETLGEPGQVVAAGQAVIRLARSGPREATVNLPETIRPAIGSSASAAIYGNSSQHWPARLRQLSNSADPLTRTYEARYVLEGAAALAPLGATVTVWIPSDQSSEASEIPLSALFDDGKQSGVWVFEPATSTVSFRPVQVKSLADETAIVIGVKPDERVAALGAHLLHDGSKVRPDDKRSATR